MIREERISLAMSKIDAGELPATLDIRTFGGVSARSTCAVCNGVIPAGSAELDLEWTSNGRASKAVVHPICYAAWDEAIRRRARNLS
jgi:hypothetical protein